MQDDLKFASDAIAKIASEAIASIERLYGNRNGLNSLQPSDSSPRVKVPEFPVIPDFTDSEPEDDLVLLKPTKATARETAKPVKPVKAPTFETVDRPPLIDSDLEKMLL